MSARLMKFAFLLLSVTFSVLTAAERTYYQPRRVSWLDNGIIINGGNHEPFIFRVRKGGGDQYDMAWQRWVGEHKEGVVLAAKENGSELFNTHGYKGFGYEAEKQDMEMLKELSALVHKHGIRLDTYCNVMTLVGETFFDEQPKAREWIQRDELGRPILLTYGFQQSYRYKPNLAHPEYRQYYKEKIVKTLVQDCRSDFLHFDNYDCNMEPESDHSPVTVEAFRKYLQDKYTPQQQRERFGHTNMQFIEPPVWNQTNSPRNIGVIVDPVQQEWIDFRCWLMADWLREVTEYARSLNPEVACETNPHGLYGVNRAFNAALWHPWFMKYTEATWSEEPNEADYNEQGVLVSKIRTYKLGRTLDNIMLTGKGYDRMYAECLAFNQTLGNFSRGGQGTDRCRYFDFYQANRQLYSQTRNREDAALLRSYATMAYDNHRAELEECMFEQAMIQSHVPFDIIFDEQMADLSRYKVLVLVGQNNLSDENLGHIARFVEGGGKVLFTGETSRCDKWGRRRPRLGLADILGIDGSWIPGRKPVECLPNQKKDAGEWSAVYVSSIIPPDREQAESWRGSWDGHLGRGTWMLPANWLELGRAVRQAAGGQLSLEIDAPDWVAVEQVQKEGLILVHLVNYRGGNALDNLPVEVGIDKGRKVRKVSLLSPDRAGGQDLKYSLEGDRCRFTVPFLEVYDVIVITLG